MSGGVRAKHLVRITLKVKENGEGSWNPRRVFGHLEQGPATKFPRCIRVYFFIISDGIKCCQQKLDEQISDSLHIKSLIVKSGYFIDKNV